MTRWITPTFVFNQDKSHGTITKTTNGQKSIGVLAGQESTSHYMITALHKQIISILHITMHSILVHTLPYTICDISDQAAIMEHNQLQVHWYTGYKKQLH